MCTPRRRLALLATLPALACLDAPAGTGPSDFAEGEPSLQCSIPTDRLFDGGVGRDGIPALTLPDVEPIGSTTWRGEVRVLGVAVNGRARAYPLPILWWHEIVNDELGDTPIVVSYCPLTGSGLVFDPVVAGETHNFGVSGLLFENNLIMFDRQTESLWNQLLMGAQCGPARGTELVRLPVIETTLRRWRQLHPNSTVVAENTGFERRYDVYPYGAYDREDNGITLFPSSEWSAARPPKELVLGIREGAQSRAYPFGILADLGEAVAVNDEVFGRRVLVTYHGTSRTSVAFDREVNGQVLTFDVADSTSFTFVDQETGSEWNRLGEAVAGPLAGSRLSPLPDAYVMFWFAWSIFYPETTLMPQ